MPRISRALKSVAVSVVAVSTVAGSAAAVSASAAVSHHSSGTAITRNVATSNAGVLDSRVLGSFGKAGTVRGFFVPARSFVRNSKTWVQGDLAATLRRGNGSLVGHVVRHDVTLPVNASGASTGSTAQVSYQQRATCNVLRLVLGPLNLNLLGLKVHLNRVVLNITAQSGSGNLLGNLLCAVSHLLDNTGATLTQILRLSSLLNRIIGILT